MKWEKYWDSKKDKFACSKGTVEDDTNQKENKIDNSLIIDELEKLRKFYETDGDKGRMFGY